MDVGLDRHQRRKRIPLPPWVEENAGWLVISIAVIAIGIPLLGSWSSGVPDIHPSQSAHISVAYGPARAWKAGSPTHLETVTIKIKNTGPATATGVIAGAVVRNQAFVLAGPAAIEAGKSESYTGKIDMNVVSTDAVHATFGCANCPDSPTGHDPNAIEAPWEKEHRLLSGQHH